MADVNSELASPEGQVAAADLSNFASKGAILLMNDSRRCVDEDNKLRSPGNAWCPAFSEITHCAVVFNLEHLDGLVFEGYDCPSLARPFS